MHESSGHSHDVCVLLMHYHECHNLLARGPLSFAMIHLLLNVSLGAAVAGAVCAGSHLEAELSAK